MIANILMKSGKFLTLTLTATYLWRTGLLILTAALLFLGASFPLTQQASAQEESSAQSKIAFDRDGHIWTMNADGSNQTIVNQRLTAVNPSLSPDGQKIVFNCGPEALDICVIDTDGTHLVQFTNPFNDSDPSWSPDGTRIAFTSTRGSVAHIYVMNADGSDLRRLTLDDASISAEEYAAWSPDGSRIAFVGTTETSTDIYTANADGSGGVTRVTFSSYDVHKYYPAWSPDGTRIAFDSIDNLYVVSASGGQEQVIASGVNQQHQAPVWSPDGTRIAFFRTVMLWGEDGNHIGNEIGLYTIRPDGTGLTSLNCPDAFNPDWKAAQSAPPTTPPTVTGQIISRQQGALATNSQIATVTDLDQPLNTLTVTASPATGSGVTVSNISVSASGAVMADVAASCTAINSTFTLTVTDHDGLMAQATLSVQVVDTTAPTLIPPAPLSAYTDLSCQATIPNVLPLANAFDSCGAPVTLQQSPAAGTPVSSGAHTITLTATDPSGNQSTATTTFTVVAVPSFTASITPSSVRRGGRVTLNAAFRNCANTRQAVTLQVRLTRPSLQGSILLATLPVTLEAGQSGSRSIPLAVPSTTPVGPYSLNLEVYVGGTKVGTSTARLNVTP